MKASIQNHSISHQSLFASFIHSLRITIKSIFFIAILLTLYLKPVSAQRIDLSSVDENKQTWINKGFRFNVSDEDLTLHVRTNHDNFLNLRTSRRDGKALKSSGKYAIMIVDSQGATAPSHPADFGTIVFNKGAIKAIEINNKSISFMASKKSIEATSFMDMGFTVITGSDMNTYMIVYMNPDYVQRILRKYRSR